MVPASQQPLGSRRPACPLLPALQPCPLLGAPDMLNPSRLGSRSLPRPPTPRQRPRCLLSAGLLSVHPLKVGPHSLARSPPPGLFHHDLPKSQELLFLPRTIMSARSPGHRGLSRSEQSLPSLSCPLHSCPWSPTLPLNGGDRDSRPRPPGQPEHWGQRRPPPRGRPETRGRSGRRA